MWIAAQNGMERAATLIDRARDFGREYPRHASFAEKLVAMVEKIVSDFSGEKQERLLTDAESTLERQRQTVESLQRTLKAIEELKKEQAETLAALERLAVVRPPNTTLH
jgi:exonuclease VII large subunit